jgi:glycosyltransferase involved in cell wall biosynthesis
VSTLGRERALRILMLTPSPDMPGPIPRHTPHLVAALEALGCEVTVAPWGRHSVDEAGGTRALRTLGDIRATCGLLRRRDFDVLAVRTSHGWAPLARDIPLLIASRRLVGAIALQFHGSRVDWLADPRHRLFGLATRIMLHFPDEVLLLSREEANRFGTLLPGLATTVVMNAFVPRWEPVTTGDGPWGEGERPLRLLFVGRMIREKGPLDAVRAVALLRDELAVTLDFAGSGPALDEARELSYRLGLDDIVTLHGQLGPDALALLFGRSDVFVFPTYWKEGFPTVLAEAMHAGLPIVTTQIRGAADHLDENVNALFVPPRSPEAIAQAVLDLAGNPGLMASMAVSNRALVSRFSPSAAGGVYLQALYRAIAASESRRPDWP